jgi:creatinine amidohydrolase
VPTVGPVLLGELPWPRIRALIERGETLALLPVGATEQHGRHLPCSTDTEIATAVCHEASRLSGVPVLPPVAFGSSQVHTTKWPGTVSLPPRLLVAVLGEVARWVAASGFARLLLVNAHVGNVGPLRVAVDEVRHRAELRVGWVNWYDLAPELAAAVAADADDWHANAAETSLMLHLRPELVDRAEIRDDPDRTGGLVLGYTVAETSRDGLTGFPSRASAVDGARLLATAGAALAARVELARHEQPPIPES